MPLCLTVGQLKFCCCCSVHVLSDVREKHHARLSLNKHFWHSWGYSPMMLTGDCDSWVSPQMLNKSHPSWQVMQDLDSAMFPSKCKFPNEILWEPTHTISCNCLHNTMIKTSNFSVISCFDKYNNMHYLMYILYHHDDNSLSKPNMFTYVLRTSCLNLIIITQGAKQREECDQHLEKKNNFTSSENITIGDELSPQIKWLLRRKVIAIALQNLTRLVSFTNNLDKIHWTLLFMDYCCIYNGQAI